VEHGARPEACATVFIAENAEDAEIAEKSKK
jgi:hypothetical protein